MANSQPKNERKSINDYLLPTEALESGNYPRSEVFEALIEEKTIGPFWQEDLKDFVNDAGLHDSDTKIRNIDEDGWMLLHEHPLFQRRKPALVGTSDINNPDNRYFLLRNGKKVGPFSNEELLSKIESLEILFTDYVSIDEGQSWGKIYEIEGFERRDLKPSKLPQMPDKGVLNNSLKDATNAVQKSKDNDQSLVSLAYIGHLNEGKKKFHIKEKTSAEKEQSDLTTKSSSKSILFIGLLSMVAILASVYFFLLAPSETGTNFKKPIAKDAKKIKPKMKKAKDVTKKVLKAKPTRTAKKVNKKPIKIEKKKVISRSSESIKKAAFFKKKKLQGQTDLREVEVPPEAIFDDNTDPVELDPIRQRISKDIIDPELEAYDEETPINELEDISRQIAPLDDFEDDTYREPAGDEEYYEDEPFYE